MRFTFSDKVHELQDIIRPYFDEWGQLKPNAPENIKEMYEELIRLMNKEYEAALI